MNMCAGYMHVHVYTCVCVCVCGVPHLMLDHVSNNGIFTERQFIRSPLSVVIEGPHCTWLLLVLIL